jgi:hypothetical protein
MREPSDVAGRRGRRGRSQEPQRVTLDDAIFIRFKICEFNDPDNGFEELDVVVLASMSGVGLAAE